MDSPIVTVYTQVYNTEQYIDQCIQSVLSQTYTNFEYIIVDNGCTDGCPEILAEYAKKDSRIRLIHFDQNQKSLGFSLVPKIAKGRYFALLDSDDWWDTNYLERLIPILESKNLDIVSTGTLCYFEDTQKEQSLRYLEHPVYLELRSFAHAYPIYWTFLSTVWASIMRMDLIRISTFDTIIQHKYAYGSDTMLMLKYLEHCNRIGIDNSTMYHYRIRKSSISYQYNSKRFEANLAYCDHIRAFLQKYNAFDSQKQEWLKRVYLSSVNESIRLALSANNPLHEKLKVCAEIADHPKTAEALQSSSNEGTIFLNVLQQLIDIGVQRGTEEDFSPLLSILQRACPQCGPHISQPFLKLCQKDHALLSLLLQDNLTELSLALLDRLSQGRYTKNFNLLDFLFELIPESPLSSIHDTKFYRKYAALCAEVIKGNTIAALDAMTEHLLNRQIPYAAETYLQLYLTLAALEQQVPAFLFGKVQLARYYLEQKNYTACQNTLQELDEMGMGEQEEVTWIKATLTKIEPEK